MSGEEGKSDNVPQPITKTPSQSPAPEQGRLPPPRGRKWILTITVLAAIVVAMVGGYIFLSDDGSEGEGENSGDDDSNILTMNIEQWNDEYTAYVMNIEDTGSLNFPNLDVNDRVKIKGNITDIEISSPPSGNVYTDINLDGRNIMGLNFAVGLTDYEIGDPVTITISIGAIMAEGIIGETVKEMFHPPSGTIGLYETEIQKDSD